MRVRQYVVCLLVALLPAAEGLLAPAAGATLLRGGQSIPCGDAAAALAQAAEGDVVLLARGSHRGPLLLAKSHLTLRGDPGARIDASEPAWTPVWRPEPGYGPQAWSSPLPFEPAMLWLDGRGMIDVRESRGGLALHAFGVGRAGRAPLGAIFTWLAKERRVVVSFPGPVRPQERSITAARDGVAAITVRGADGCLVEGLIVTGGREGVTLEATRGSTVRGCLVYACDVGIRLGRGASACRVLGNDVTLHADGLNANCDPSSGLAGDDVWGAHKNYGTYDKTGIAADDAGAGNEIAGNWLYDVWDGIENGNAVGKAGVRAHIEALQRGGTAEANRGLQVHHNRIDLAMDDALSPGNDQMEHRWYSNVVTRARCAVRFKSPDIGPFHFFDNLLLDNSDGLRLYKSTPACAIVVIHNNLVVHPDGVIYHKMESVPWDDPGLLQSMPRGTPGFHLYGNIFVGERQFTWQGQEVPPDFAADRNLFTCARSPLPALQAKDAGSLFSVTPEFADPAAGDWRLKAGSPGLGAGMPFAAFPVPASLPVGWTPPERPDMGLLRIDPGLTPRGPVSGLWQLAAGELGLGERRPEDLVLPAERWLLLGRGAFVVEGAGLAGVDLLRAADRAKGAWKVEAVAADGSVLASVAGGPPGLQTIPLRFTVPAAGRVTIRVEDANESRWRVREAAGLRIGIVGAANLRLAKYDGSPYALLSEQPESGTEIRVALRRDFAEGPCRIGIGHPDGSRGEIVPDVPAALRLAGTCRLDAEFAKRAELDWPAGEVLWLAEQRRVPLRSRWPKPAY